MGTMQRAQHAPLGRYRGSFSAGRGGNLAQRAALSFVDLMILWQRRLQDREVLREMTDAQLQDIGIRRGDALSEADKPFWRA